MSLLADFDDGQPRCRWCAATRQLRDYHDHEWGYPVADDRRLFEKLCLESFQSGLSWRTILEKREGFRAAFAGFDPQVMARFDAADVQRLLADPRIVRNRSKIEAVIHNAGKALELIAAEGSLAAFIWRFEAAPDPTITPQSRTTSPESVALAKALKQRGWKFVGPTTLFAFMQSMGLVNDHAAGCVTRPRVAQALQQFRRPG